MKYTVSATLRIDVEIPVRLENPPSEELDFEDAVMRVANERLVLLDIRGGRSGGDGFIESMECEQVNNWNAE